MLLTGAGGEKPRILGAGWRILLIAFTLAGIGLAINQIFLLRPILDNQYLYWLLGIYLSLVFIVYPATRTARRNGVPWYDVFLFLLTLGSSSYLAYRAWDLQLISYVFIAPPGMTIVALILCLVALEAIRRTGGTVLFIFTTIFAIYPMFAYLLPGILSACRFSPWSVIRYHALGLDSLLGIPTQVFGLLIFGFLIFGAVLAATGGGKFFLDSAFALFGTHRGGPAKVAVFASGLFGSLSGDPVSNVITTGCVTIPAMKRTGYSPHFAAAVETTASTGGALMPPVMGSTAFIMAVFLGIPYFQVCIAAIIPSLLYYLGIFIQVDAFAARTGLRGINKSEVSPILTVLKSGWPFIFAFVLLVYLLAYSRVEGEAPFIAMAALLALAMMRKKTRLGFKGFIELFENIGRLLPGLVGILAAIGLIIGAFSITGVASSFSRELVALSGGIPFLMLVFGAIASFILGMGMTISACYIFLAIILAPGLVAMGFNPIAVHLFVLYWGMMSFITPPVALASYVAAGLAGASPIKTAIQAMRLGIVAYLVPFVFVYSPALILQVPIPQAILPFLTAAMGVVLLAGGVEGFSLWSGKLSLPCRLIWCISGVLLFVVDWRTDIIGVFMASAAAIGLHMASKRRKRHV